MAAARVSRPSKAPVAWVVDLNASPEELLKQAEALEEDRGPRSLSRAPLATPQQRSRFARPAREQGRLSRRASGAADSMLLSALAECPQILMEILSTSDVRIVGVLPMLQRRFRELMSAEESWQGACHALAWQAQLYVPHVYALGWKRIFWDQLWPARRKWVSQEGDGTDFEVRVGVRFKPAAEGGRTDSAPELFLPLHQRLRLWRAGKLRQEELLQAEGGTDLVEALTAQGELSPEIVEAILSAQHLKAQSAEARAQAAAAGRRRHAGVDEEDISGALNAADLPGPDEAPALAAAAAAGPTIAAAGPAAGAAAASASQEAAEEEEAPRARRGGQCRVLAVQSSRVMTYIPGQGARGFSYARVLSDSQPQQAVYGELGHDMICSMLNGFNSCLLCYGQTGSGKTHTLFGPDGCFQDALRAADEEALPMTSGIALRSLHELLGQSKHLQSQKGVSVSVTCQYVEIYNEQVTDLLAGGSVQVRGPRATLVGAAEAPIETFREAVELLVQGQERKHIAQTAMNERSSRAHTVFALNLTQVNERLGSTVTSTLHLVDLAGSEQLKLSQATGQRQVEAIGINTSLMVLGRVITALVEGHGHVPYYESVLTQLLRPALGGRSRTTVVVTASSDDAHGDQTLHALRFGERCQRVVNRAALEAVTNVGDALRTIDEALQTCQDAMARQKERGLDHLPGYQRLREKYEKLTQTRSTLTAGGSREAN